MKKRHTLRPEATYFFKYIDPEIFSKCWSWKGTKSSTGYGQLRIRNKLTAAHRYSYKLFYGEFDKYFFVCHKCDNPTCVNPTHLFLGHYQENSDDKISKSRQMRGTMKSDSKLTDSKVRQIRNLYKSGLISQTEIAKTYRITASCISRIIRFESWKHVI